MENKLIPFLEKIHKNDCSGHDIFHLKRVVNLAKYIQNKEGGNLELIELSAWLHDVGDYKLNNGIDKTSEMVSIFFDQNTEFKKHKEYTLNIISEVSFKGGFNKNTTSLEAKIVQDADRLDAIGAIGIARTFAYGGLKGTQIFNGKINKNQIKNFEDYKNINNTTIDHFYDKLLKIKDLINTDSAKQIAEKRHKILIDFLENFYQEWNFK